MLPRVVITGMGVVSPNGIGKEAFCRAILAGKSGVKRIPASDSSCLPVHIAGEISEFDELAWVDARERKHVSRVVPLSIAATNEAFQDSGLDVGVMTMEEKRQIGVILGTGGGARGIFRGTISALALGAEKGEPVRSAQRDDGHNPERNQHALWFSWIQPRCDRRLHVFNRCNRLRLSAHSS